jgi:predicted phosphodiesterase
MRYAIISDIHGNLHALKAVLADAQISKADRYLLLGDYFLDFPYPNEVVDTIRAIPEANVIKGNKEENLFHLSDEDLKRKQMAPARWNLNQFTDENKKYLMSLPETMEISENDITIRLSHSSDIFFRNPWIQPFYSSCFCEHMQKTPFNHDEYLAFALEALLSRQDALADIEALPKGIYLFGHNHLQFHAEYKGRIFINPGSCGASCDCDTTAAYTLLDIEGKSYNTIERRVAYDIKKALEGLRSSSLSAEAPEWRKLVEKLLLDGQDCFHLFLTHVYETGRQLGDSSYPVTDETWEKATAVWDFNAMQKRT